MAEPVALAFFVAAFAIVLIGGSVLMFLVKGGVVDVMLAAHDAAGPIEHEGIAFESLRQAACFSMDRFVGACGRLFRRYLVLGAVLMLAYAASGASYLVFIIYGYRMAGEAFGLTWTLMTALLTVVLVLWITVVRSPRLRMGWDSAERSGRWPALSGRPSWNWAVCSL
jgi:hypothetical protein